MRRGDRRRSISAASNRRVGLAGAPGLNRLLASLLFGVEPTDPTTFAAVTCTIAIVAALACALPAWRAARLDPNIVLRDG
jgi:putative ABC transport system permease protein